MEDIRDIANLLDDTIAKGDSLKENDLKKAKRNKEHRSELRKSITFNPMRPADMSTGNFNYYTPYHQREDGTFQPHSANYWLEQIDARSWKNRRDYREGYDHLREYFKSETASKDQLTDTMNKLIKSVEEEQILKAKLPVGTVHEWGGVQMKKVSEGKGWGDWQPVDGGKGGHPVEESVGQKRAKIEQELAARKQGKPEPKGGKERNEELDNRTKELDERERKLRHDELAFREKQVSAREKAAGIEKKESQSDSKDASAEDKKDGKKESESASEPDSKSQKEPVGSEAFDTFANSVDDSDDLKENSEVKRYTRAVSDYLYSLHHGGKDVPELRPREPDILRDTDIKFDWNSLTSTSKPEDRSGGQES